MYVFLIFGIFVTDIYVKEGVLMKKLYFAHPVNVYDTLLEESLVAFLKWTFGQGLMGGECWEIENPNQPHHQVGYADWKKRLEGDLSKQGGMSYYYDVVLPQCHGCVALAFLDDMLGAGVAGELKFFIDRNLPVFELGVDVDGGCSMQGVIGIGDFEKHLISSSDPSVVLSIEETRARTWVSPEEYNNTKLDYLKAHIIAFESEKWTSEYIKSLKK